MKALNLLLPAVLISACAASPEVAAPPAQTPNDYFMMLQNIISSNTRYPPAAVTAREQGVVVVRVDVGRDGRIMETALMKAAKYQDLNDESLKVFKRISTFPPVPASISPGVTLFRVELPITFSLEYSAGTTDPRISTNREMFNQWGALVTAAIKQNWVHPEELDKNLTTRVLILVSRQGEVQGATVIDKSGAPAFDDSVLQAITQAAPLPAPADPAFYFPAIRVCLSLNSQNCQ